jgi:hypothetical protein
MRVRKVPHCSRVARRTHVRTHRKRKKIKKFSIFIFNRIRPKHRLRHQWDTLNGLAETRYVTNKELYPHSIQNYPTDHYNASNQCISREGIQHNEQTTLVTNANDSTSIKWNSMYNEWQWQWQWQIDLFSLHKQIIQEITIHTRLWYTADWGTRIANGVFLLAPKKKNVWNQSGWLIIMALF